MVFTILAVRRNSPRMARPSTSSSIFWERSPLATAPITRSISVTGWTREVTSSLTLSTAFRQQPEAPEREARSAIRPLVPTASAMRSSSSVSCSFREMMALRVSAMRAAVPSLSTTSRAEKSPLCTAVRTDRSSLGSSPSSVLCPFALAAAFFGLEREDRGFSAAGAGVVSGEAIDRGSQRGVVRPRGGRTTGGAGPPGTVSWRAHGAQSLAFYAGAGVWILRHHSPDLKGCPPFPTRPPDVSRRCLP
jgi:hypothetical protein